jgi:uncharacterized protein
VTTVRILHPSGALWLPDVGTLIVADLHLGYGLAQRRRGELGAVADTETAEKLTAVVQELIPKQLVLLGDAVHAPRPSKIEKDWIQHCFRSWASTAAIFFVRGNHDRRISLDFAVETSAQWRSPGWIGVHGDGMIPEPGNGETLVVGHLHPAVGIEDAAGVKRKIPVFLESEHILVLPAFSPFAAGVDVLRRFPTELSIFGGRTAFKATAATGRRIAPLGPLSRLRFPGSDSSAASFRKRG